MKKLFKWLVDFAVSGAIIFLLGSYISYFVSSSTLSIFSILGLLFRPIFYCALLICFVAFISKRSSWKYLFISLLIGLYFWPLQFQLFGSTFDEDSDQIKLATFNMQFSKPLLKFEGSQFDLEKGKLKAILGKKLSDHDILAVQECGYLTLPLVKSIGFKHDHSASNNTIHIYSQFPIVNSGEIRISMNQVNTCIWSDIVFPNQDTIRVYNVHMESNRFTGVVPKTIHQDTKEEMTFEVAWGLVKNFDKFTYKRQTQIEQILEHMDKSPYKCLIMGDFNDPAMSYNYHLMSQRFNDVFHSGKAWGTTLKSRFVKMRIDFIWVDKAFQYGNYDSYMTPYSDHALVSAVMKISQ